MTFCGPLTVLKLETDFLEPSGMAEGNFSGNPQLPIELCTQLDEIRETIANLTGKN